MLEGLDTIDWGSLTHAYGEATDVPRLLRSLLSPDAKQREQAIYALFGNIWHQGTVYPATAAAVPFLYELLTAPETPGKSEIANLLSCIANGRGYLEVHAVGDFGESTWRRILAKEGKSLEEEMEREAAEIESVRQAVSTGLIHLLSYLRAAAISEPDEEVRKALRESTERLTRRRT